MSPLRVIIIKTDKYYILAYSSPHRRVHYSDTIRNLREKDRRNLRANIQELEKCAFDAFRQRSALKEVIKAAPNENRTVADGSVNVASTDMDVVDQNENGL